MPPIACVTGATGFLASELTRQLLQQGWHVQATVRSTPRAKFLYALPKASSHLKLFEADLLAPQSFDECVKDADHVFHTASPFITSNITDPDLELHRPELGSCFSCSWSCSLRRRPCSLRSDQMLLMVMRERD